MTNATGGPGCPHCRAVVQPDWDWCHACGFDPEGLKPSGWVPAGAMSSSGRGAAAAARPPGVPASSIAPPLAAGSTWGPSLSPGAPWPAAPVVAPKRSSGAIRSLIIVAAGVVILLLAGVVLVGPRLAKSAVSTKSGAGAKDPVTYTGPDGRFSAGLSGAPITKEESMDGGVVLHGWGWDGGPNGQLVFWFATPPGYEPAMEQEALDSALDGAVTGNGTSATATVLGHVGRSFTGTFDGVDGQGLMFIDGNTFWMLFAGGPWAGQDPQAHAFLDSFQLLPPVPPASN